MNKFIGTGNLCKDIELRYTTSNIAAVQNTIAIRNDFKNANGEYESQFINFIAYRNNAEFLSKYASKGSKVLIEGRINNRSYDKQDGTKAYITEVIVDKAELLSSPVKSGQVAENEQESPVKSGQQIDPFAQFGSEVELTDDMLPF